MIQVRRLFKLLKLSGLEVRTCLRLSFCYGIMSSILELISVFSIAPILNYIKDPSDKVAVISRLNSTIFGFGNHYGYVIVCLVTSIIISLFSGLFRAFVFYNNSLISSQLGHKISIFVFSRAVERKSRSSAYINSDRLLNSFLLVEPFIGGVIQPLLQATTNLTVSLIFIVSLILVQPAYSSVLLILVICSYLAVNVSIKRVIHQNSQLLDHYKSQYTQFISETSRSMIEINHYSLHNRFIIKFTEIDQALRKIYNNLLVLSGLPRYFIETLSVIAVLLTILISIISFGETNYVAFALILFALQKILPSAQQVFMSYQNIKGNAYIVDNFLDICQLYQQESHTENQLAKRLLARDHKVAANFDKIRSKDQVTLDFRNVSFKYNNSADYIINNFNLSLCRGEHVCITGPSGSGKSTLIQLALNILTPTSGSVHILDQNIEEIIYCSDLVLRDIVGYVPQSPFFFGKSILENITFLEELNCEQEIRLKRCIRVALLDILINDLPSGIHHQLSPGGNNLSGGQLQRISIARALFSSPKVLILDEATSALDNYTQTCILNNITSEFSHISILSVSHRSEYLEMADRVVYLKK